MSRISWLAQGNRETWRAPVSPKPLALHWHGCIITRRCYWGRRMLTSPHREAERGRYTCIYLNPELAAYECKFRQLEVSVFPFVK